jgi:hypothetical protein
MKTTLALIATLFLTSCGYFEASPDRTWFEYDETTSLCAKVLEYPDRIVILYVDCSKTPDSIRRVKYFGEGVDDGD